MLCEMCGTDTGFVKTVSIDGAMLRACDRCAKFGTEVKSPVRPMRASGAAGPVRAPPKKRAERDIYDEMVTDLADDYPRRIMRARNALGLNQEELGKKINERKSVIQKLEAGDMVPDNRLIGKLERFLKIKLRVPRKEEHLRAPSDRRPVTIGDLIDLKK